jgi:aryl-alcohol dehydrogenase-like predicted oxidoreductase
MSQLVKEGAVRFLGLRSRRRDARRACKVHQINALQSEYWLWSRDPEDGVLQACRDLGIGFVANSPLGHGFLTGQIKSFDDLAADDYRRMSPRFQGDNFAKNLALVDRIHQMATAKKCTPSQLALAWTMAQGDDIVPIPGTKRRKYLEENLGAAEVKLTREDLARIDEIAPKGRRRAPLSRRR